MKGRDLEASAMQRLTYVVFCLTCEKAEKACDHYRLMKNVCHSEHSFSLAAFYLSNHLKTKSESANQFVFCSCAMTHQRGVTEESIQRIDQQRSPGLIEHVC